MEEGMTCPIVLYDKAGEKIIGATKCPVCSSYYDITYEKQIEAAKLLERGVDSYEVQYIGDSLWKVTPKKRGAIAEFLTAKTLIDRARARQLAESEPHPVRKRRRKTVDVPLDSGRSDESVEAESSEDVRRNTDERKRKQRTPSSDGQGSSGTVRRRNTRASKLARKKASTIRKPRQRVSQPEADNNSGKTRVATRRKRSPNSKQSGRTRRRN